jgi:hypothetical protein
MRGAPFVSGASDTLDRIDTLDPIEAAEIDIAGSKDLIASVTDEISQHQRWIENYRVSEKRHARWLQFQEIRYQLELKRRALTRALKRFSLNLALLARAIWAFTVKWTTAFIAWLTPRAYALALTLRRWVAAALAWTWATAVSFARGALKEASIAFAWIAVTSRDFARGALQEASIALAWIAATSRYVARASLKAASTALAWIAVTSRDFARALFKAASIALAWVAVKSRAFARTSVKAISITFAWIGVQSVALAHALQRLLYRAWLKGRILARASLKAASIAFAWITAKSCDAARASLTAASIAVAWIAVQSAGWAHSVQRLLYRAWLEWRIFARAALKAVSAGSSRAAKRSRVFARTTQRSAIAGSSWLWARTGSLAQALLDGLVFVGAKSQRLFDKRVVSSIETTQPAQTPITSQCTALVCIEPWRARLPAIRQLNGAMPGLSWQLPSRSAARPPA